MTPQEQHDPRPELTTEPVMRSARLDYLIPSFKHIDDITRLCQDPVVMKFVGGEPWPDDKIAEYVRRSRENFHTIRACFFSVFERDSGAFIGSAGVTPISKVGPELEVGYRFLQSAWGRGYATETAAAALEYGFNELQQETILAVTHPDNQPSQRVLRKIGMRHTGQTDKYYDTCTELFMMTRDQHAEQARAT